MIREHVENGNLRQNTEASRNTDHVLRWVQEMTKALIFIDSNGELHGDLRCPYLLRDGNTDLKLGALAGPSRESALGTLAQSVFRP